jgi:hypothetical protein
MNSIWSFIVMHKKFNNCTLFDALHMAVDKSSILNHKLCKPLSLSSRNTRQTKVQGTTNKVGQILLQAYTVCARYLHGGSTF